MVLKYLVPHIYAKNHKKCVLNTAYYHAIVEYYFV